MLSDVMHAMATEHTILVCINFYINHTSWVQYKVSKKWVCDHWIVVFKSAVDDECTCA